MTDIKKKIKDETISQLYSDYYTGQEIWYFKELLQLENHSEAYDDFKKYISDKLKVHFNDIAIVGSSKQGFSLSHLKEFHKFDQGKHPSDIDLVIVSGKYFEKFWLAYLTSLYDGKYPRFRDLAKAIFKGFLSVDDADNFHPELREWIVLVNSMKKDLELFHEIRHVVKYRIFRSWDYVEIYYKTNLKLLKQKLELADLKKKIIFPSNSKTRNFYIAKTLDQMSRTEILKLLSLLKEQIK